MINAADGYHLWSESYDRPLTNIFAVQDEIALAVVEVLKVKLLGAAPRVSETDPAAYNFYLQGRHFSEMLEREPLAKAVAAYQASLEIDPDYAPAWAGLAEAHMLQAGGSHIDLADGFAKSREMIERALILDPQLPYAWITLSRLQSNWDWDWVQAEASLQKARELEPDNTEMLYALAELKASEGQTAEAIAICKRITVLDPLDQRAYHDQGRLLIEQGDLAAAEHCYNHLLSINPHHRNTHGFMGRIHMKRGNGEKALQEVQQLKDPFWRTWASLLINYGLLHTPESEQDFADFIASNKHDSAVQIAQIHGSRGDIEEALDWLEVAYDQRDAGLAQSLLNDSLFNCLYGNPRMQAIAEKIGLKDYYLAKLETR